MSLTMREQHGLRCWRIGCSRRFGPKRHEGTGKWGRQHNEELYDLHFSPNIIRVIESRRMNLTGDRWQVAGMGDRRGAYRVLVGRREGKRPLGRPRCRRESRRMNLAGDRWQVWETGEVHTGFWWGDVRERDYLEDLGVDAN